MANACRASLEDMKACIEKGTKTGGMGRVEGIVLQVNVPQAVGKMKCMTSGGGGRSSQGRVWGGLKKETAADACVCGLGKSVVGIAAGQCVCGCTIIYDSLYVSRLPAGLDCVTRLQSHLQVPSRTV